MLPPDARTVLTDVLRPPPGTTLNRAVALTYSLDLESALVIPLAFAGQVLRKSSDPVAVMEAVRGCADRVDVFCQAGQVTVPRQGTDLLAFLEPVVHPVRRPRPGRLFHPKLWALRFRAEDGGTDHARLLVLSRNLTDDRTSWDVCLRLDGAIGTRNLPMNRPIADLINRTLALCVTPIADERHDGIMHLVGDLRRVAWERPDGVRELAFYTLGVPGQSRPDFTGTRHLAFAPFCNERGIATTVPSPGGTVISRQDDLDRLPDDALDGRQVFVVNELAGIPAEESGEKPGRRYDILTGLHAKLYVVESGHAARVLVGSANATDAAYGGNIEILAELTGPKTRLGIDALLSTDGGFGAILEPYDRGTPKDEDPDDRLLADLLRDIAAVPLTATVERTGDELAIRLSSESPVPAAAEGFRITAELVTRPGEAAPLTAGMTVDGRFGPLAAFDVTPFVVLTARTDHDATLSTVVCARLVGDPPGRFDEVIARQVDTPEKFLRFLALLLGLTGDPAVILGDGTGGGAWGTASGTGILELLLRGLVDRPAQLDDLARLVERLSSTEDGRKVLPDGFAELWAVVDEVRRELAAERAS